MLRKWSTAAECVAEQRDLLSGAKQPLRQCELLTLSSQAECDARLGRPEVGRGPRSSTQPNLALQSQGVLLHRLADELLNNIGHVERFSTLDRRVIGQRLQVIRHQLAHRLDQP